MTLRSYIACMIGCTASAALATPAKERITLQGTTAIAAEKRPTAFVFSCSTSGRNVIGGLSITIRIPLGTQPGFDFAPFEGPSGTSQALSILYGRSAVRTSRSSFSATGGYQLENSFSLTVSAAVNDTRRLSALGRVLAPLLDRGTLTWQQSGPRPGAPRFSAVLQTRQDEAAQLSRTLRPCIARPRRLLARKRL